MSEFIPYICIRTSNCFEGISKAAEQKVNSAETREIAYKSFDTRSTPDGLYSFRPIPGMAKGFRK